MPQNIKVIYDKTVGDIVVYIGTIRLLFVSLEDLDAYGQIFADAYNAIYHHEHPHSHKPENIELEVKE